MAENSISQEKQELIKHLHEERKIAANVTASAGALGIIEAYNSGETIKALEKLHKNFSETRGRIFPFFEEDYEVGESFEPAGNEDDALGDVVYHWGCLDLSTNFSNFAYHLSELENHISDLSSWHPRSNADTGEIDD